MLIRAGSRLLVTLAVTVTLSACAPTTTDGNGPTAITPSTEPSDSDTNADTHELDATSPSTSASDTFNEQRAVRQWAQAMRTGVGGCALLTPDYRQRLRDEVLADGVVAADATCGDVLTAHRLMYAEFGYDATSVRATTSTETSDPPQVIVDAVNPDGSGFGTFIFIPHEKGWLLDDITLPRATN